MLEKHGGSEAAEYNIAIGPLNLPQTGMYESEKASKLQDS